MSSADTEAPTPAAPVSEKSTTSGDVCWFFEPGKYGTYMSLIILILGIVVSIIAQQYAPDHINLSSWNDGCSGDYEDECKSSSAVLRMSFALSALYLLQVIGTSCYTKFYDIFWIIKFLCFIFILIGFYFTPVEVFDLRGYAWFARITGFIYLILQQIILLDMAYTWNEKWLSLSTEDGEHGKLYLGGLLFFSIGLFMGSIVVISILFWQFDGCLDNKIILSLTIIYPTIATIIQIFFTEEGSLLTSAIMTSYSVYVCYSAITLNPNISCNPALDTNYQELSTAIGLVILVLSIGWATYTTAKRIPSVTNSGGQTIDLMNIATGGAQNAATGSTQTLQIESGGIYETSAIKILFVQISIVFMLAAGYYAMALTNWTTEQEGRELRNPRAGRAAMWIQASGQWIAITIYLWSLIAPKILTNRDFS